MGHRVLVVGNGGRAQALAYRLARDAMGNLVRDVLVSPGNDGMSSFQTCVSPEQEGPAGTIWTANRLEAGLVVLNEETRDSEGLADLLRGQGRDVVGPTLKPSLSKVVFEQNGTGDVIPNEQLSIMALCNGSDALLFPPLKTYFLQKGSKVVPMASIGPFLQVDNNNFLQRVKQEIILPVLSKMEKIGRPILGPLTIRLSVQGEEIVSTQILANFTTPETQTYMFGAKADLLPIFSVIAKNESLSRFSEDMLMKMRPTATIRVATGGYPESKVGGDTIELKDFDKEHGMVFFDSVRRRSDRQLETIGGPVFSCTGTAQTVELAIKKSYDILEKVHFVGAEYLQIS